MFLDLLRKEFKQVFCCTTYYVIVICIILFYNTQIGEFDMIQKPKPNQEDYGVTYSKDETVIMDKTIQILFREYGINSYGTYPVGFYKEVTLGEAEQKEVLQIMSEVTGKSLEEISDYYETLKTDTYTTDNLLEISVSPELTYHQFRKLMKELDYILGGGSSYSESYLLTNSQVSMTYEDALEEYNDIMEKDHLTGAYARLFCDYIGIILLILPVFLAVTRSLRDKRAQANQVIYVRRASSFHIIFSRYLAMLIVILLPIFVIAAVLTVQCAYNGAGAGIKVDYLAFVKYILGWLLPGVLVTLSVGLFFTELTETAIAILIQGILWFAGIFLGVSKIRGGYGWNLIPRHNTLGGYEVYRDYYGQLVVNRILYTVIAVVLLVATIYIYDKKRKGVLRLHGKTRSNRKSKSEV